MPLARYQIRNEYSLADPELHRAADKDDPEALLEAVTMSGLVGVLRQLGDLAEFAAKIFHDLHEEVMATSARGHDLMARVQQIEAEFPSIEKAFLSQTEHSSFFFNAGIDWHPNHQCDQNVVTRGDLPRFVMDSYEECRGPPRLFLLDKFDVAGAGACLKRYTDPSFIKMEAASSGIDRAKVHREKRIYKVKLQQKKGTHRRNGETPEVGARTKLHQLLLEERLENAYTHPARLVKLKKRQLNGFAIETKTGKSYMKRFLETPSPDHKIVCETSMIPLHVKLTSGDTNEEGVRILGISTFSPVKRTIGHENTCLSLHEQELGLKPFTEVDGEADGDLVKLHGERPPSVVDEISVNHLEAYETEWATDGQKKIEGSIGRYHSDGVVCEVDNYLDALTTRDLEMETDNEYRLKYSFLNVRRATDADGKEEHRLQAQFSDSQSFGDSFMSDKSSSSKRDKNEEHAEIRAHFSDSESIGISPVSEKTSSLKRDRNPERMELHAHFSDSQSIGNSTSDEISSIRKDRTYSSHNNSSGPVVEDIESDGRNTLGLLSSINCSLVKTDDGKFVRQGNAYVKEEEIPVSGQVSSNSYLMNSGHMSLGSDVETIMQVDQSTETQFQEKLPDSIEHYSKLPDDEDRKYVVENVASGPDALSQTEGDVCLLASSENIHVRMFGDAASYVDSCALLQGSNVLESTPEDQGHVPKINLFPGEAQNVSLDCSSYPSMAVDLSLGPMLPPDGLHSKSQDVFKATQLSIKDSSPVVETSMASDFEGGQCSDLAHGNTQDEPGSESFEVLYHDQQAHVQEISRMVHCDEINASTYSVGAVEDNCHFGHLSSSDYGRQNNHIMLCDAVTQEANSEDKAVFVVPSADNIEINANVRYTASGLKPTTNPANLQESYLGSSGSYQMQMESNEIESTEIFTNLDAGRRHNQLEQSSDLISSNIISSPMWDLRDYRQFLSDSVDIHGKENRVNEAVARESLSESEAQKAVDQFEVTSANIISTPMKKTHSEESLSNFMDHDEKEVEANEGIAEESLTELHEPKFVDQLEVTSSGVKSSLETCVSNETAESETCIDIEDSSFKEQILPHSVSDATIGLNFSGIDIQESQSKSLTQNGLLHDGKDDMSLASDNVLRSEISSEQFLQSRVGQKNVEVVLINEENYRSENLQSTQTQISNELEKGESSHATSGAPDIHPYQPSARKLLSESAGEEINRIKHDINPLKPLVSAYYTKLAHINLEDMPPMPPLPPMQWRMNKFQNTSLALQRESEVSETSFLPIQPIESDETTKFGFLGPERQAWQYQKPFLPVTAVEGDRLQHTSGFSMGFPGHPVAIPLQFPVVFNEPNSPYNYLYLDRSSQYLQSPVVSFPVISTGRPPHGDHIVSKGEVAQYSGPGTPAPSVENAFEHDSVQEKVNQPSSQIVTDTNSVQEKVTQPSSQMMADSNSEADPLEESSSNLQGEQEVPFVSSKSPPVVETVLPNVNTLRSEGEMALSSDTSNQTSGFEGEMPNGKPHNKLPRPRSPLVDAVAAHDKSKLRRVVERVRSQIAPKENETDSFLEQIRTKSFNLKPASVTRPNIQGPKTNLRVAAILEKANAIRQAFAGSDEDDDADRWSDS